jgi:putative SOS response-associated peptidase YedK
MCGRLSLTAPGLDEVARDVGARFDPADASLYRPHYNLGPSSVHFIVQLRSGERWLVPALWGLETRASRAAPNLRSETARRGQRCLVPADGFFEWTGTRRDRRPIWLHLSGQLLLMAGIVEERGAERPTFAVLTTEARGAVREIHPRMPLLIAPARAQAWLAGATGDLSDPRPLLATPVSPRANSVEHDDAACLDPMPPPQLRLL